MSRPAIVFIGFMGAGKCTALGAARAAGLETTEIDELMEAELGKPIAEAFEQRRRGGLPGARGRGRRRAARASRRRRDRARRRQRPLRAGPRGPRPPHRRLAPDRASSEAWRRIANTDRPLATSAEDVARLLAERLPLYEQLADAVVPPADRDVVCAGAAGDPGARPISPPAPSCSGRRALRASTRSSSAAACSMPAGGRWRARRFCVTDRTVGPLYAERLAPLAATVEVAPGEEAKTMAEAERVLRELARAGMTRDDHLVALGGGVVGDLAGFCAHIYQRGVPVVQVPTTLVAQVDSAYGGKTGVDLPEGKNYAGAYHLPAAVLADTGDPGHPARGGAGRRLRRGAEDGPARGRRALGAGAGDRGARPRRTSTTSSSPAPATSARSSPPTSATPACATASTSATRSATRSRRRAATPATATARRSGSACSRRCASPTHRSCASEVRGEPRAATACRSRSTPRSTSTRSSTRWSATRSAPPRASASSSSPSPESPARGSWSTPLGSGRPWRSWSNEHHPQPRRRPARGQLRHPRAPRRRRSTAASRWPSWSGGSPAGRASWGWNRSSSRPTTRASSSSTCTGCRTWPTRRSSTPAPGPTTAARSPTRSTSPACRRSRSTSPTSSPATTGASSRSSTAWSWRRSPARAPDGYREALEALARRARARAADAGSRRPAGGAARRARARPDAGHRPGQRPLPDRLHRHQRRLPLRPGYPPLLHRLPLHRARRRRGRGLGDGHRRERLAGRYRRADRGHGSASRTTTCRSACWRN